jgi:hypothetical protein
MAGRAKRRVTGERRTNQPVTRRKNALVEEAIAMITAAGHKPMVVTNKHAKVKWRQDGRWQTLVCAISPGDRRAIHHSRAILRRLLGGSIKGGKKMRVRAFSLQAMEEVIKRHGIKPVNGQYHFTAAMVSEAIAFDEKHGSLMPSDKLESLKSAIEGKTTDHRKEVADD